VIGKQTPRVALVIVNWNSWWDTLECLESVFSLDYPEYLTVLVDNGSTNDSIQRIQQWYKNKKAAASGRGFLYISAESKEGRLSFMEKRLAALPSCRRLVLIDTRKNLGFAEGNNIAFHYLLKSSWKADFFFLLNNDAMIEKTCFRHAVALAEQSQAGVIGASILNSEGRKVLFSGDWRRPEFFYMKFRERKKEQLGDSPSIQALGSGMLIRREALQAHERQYGYFFNCRLFMYGEETEFCLHLLKLGYKIYVSRRAIVYHKESRSVSSTERKPMQLYYMTRNTIAIVRSTFSSGWRIFFHLIYAPIRLRLALSLLFQGYAKEAMAILQGIQDGYGNHFGKWRHHPSRHSKA
jgi:GT2 family glycosyltransferase